jgi:F0F1-type ATP synthase assembly protein I
MTSDPTPPSDPSGDPPEGPDEDQARREANRAWGAFNVVIAGALVWGGIGWALSAWLGSPLFLPLGLLVGTGAALYLVWLRYGGP